MYKYVYLVLEELDMSLENLFIKNNNEISKDECRIFIFQMLEGLYNIHSYGILHNDIKASNIMLDIYDNIKYIDFGLSKFIGFGPTHDMIDRYNTTPMVMAPDESKYNPTNRKTYASDVFSLGSTIIHIIIKKYGFVTVKNENKIFIKDLEEKYYDISNKIYDTIGPDVYDLICKLLILDTKKRISAKQALNHKYFINSSTLLTPPPLLQNPFENNKSMKMPVHNNMNDDDGKTEEDLWLNAMGGNSFVNNESFNYIQYSEIDYQNKYYELQYLEEIHNNYKNDVLKVVVNKNQVNNYLLLFYDEIITGIDCFINGISNCIYDFTGIYIYSCIFNDGLPKYKARLLNYNTREMIVDNNGIFNYVPISIHIYYIYIKLKYENDVKLNVDFLIDMSIFMIYFYTRPLNFDSNIPVWKIAIFSALKILSKQGLQFKYDILKLNKEEYYKLNIYFNNELKKEHIGEGYEYIDFYIKKILNINRNIETFSNNKYENENKNENEIFNNDKPSPLSIDIPAIMKSKSKSKSKPKQIPLLLKETKPESEPEQELNSISKSNIELKSKSESKSESKSKSETESETESIPEMKSELKTKLKSIIKSIYNNNSKYK